MTQQQFEKYKQIAFGLGAVNVVKFDISEIVFDPRTILKCMYGCNDWGRHHNCPSDPKSLKIEEYIRIFKLYKCGVIIHAHDKDITQKASLAIESAAFVDGHYFALSLSDCNLCKECMHLKDKPCAFPAKARPAFHSVGIDVFATAKNFKLPIKTLADRSEEQNWYSAVFVK